MMIGTIAAATFIPLFIGLFAPRFLGPTKLGNQTFLATVSSGILFWSFLDWMNDAALLGVNQGFSRNYTNIILALLFGIGLTLFVWMEKSYPPKTRAHPAEDARALGFGVGARSSDSLTSRVAGIAALSFGFHSLGEGVAIGAQLVGAASLLNAFGGISPGVSYVLHKFLEGFSVGVFGLLAQATSTRKLGILGVIVGLPTILGVFLGVPRLTESTYFFAVAGA